MIDEAELDDEVLEQQAPFEDGHSSDEEEHAELPPDPNLTYVDPMNAQEHDAPHVTHRNRSVRSASAQSSSSQAAFEEPEEDETDEIGTKVFHHKKHDVGVTDHADASGLSDGVEGPSGIMRQLDEDMETAQLDQVLEERQEDEPDLGLEPARPLPKPGRARVGEEHPASPAPSGPGSSVRTGGGAAANRLGVREESKQIRDLQSEIWNLKMRLKILETRLQDKQPSQLQLENERLQEDIFQLTEVNKGLKKTLKDLQRALNTRNRDFEDAQAELLRLKARHDYLPELEQLRSDYASLEKLLQASQREAKNLRAHGRVVYREDGAQSEISGLKDELEIQRGQCDRLMRERDQLRGQLAARSDNATGNESAQLHENNMALQNDLSLRSREHLELEEERDALLDQVEQLRQENADLQSQGSPFRLSNAEHQRTLDALQREADRWRDEHHNAQITLQEYEDDQEQLMQDSRAREEEYAARLEQYAAQESEFQDLIDAYAEDLAAKEQEVAKCNQVIEEFKSTIEQQLAENNDLEADIESFAHKVDEQVAELEQLARERDIVKRDLADQKTVHAETHSKWKERDRTHKDALARLEREHGDSKAQVKELDERYRAELAQRQRLERERKELQRRADDLQGRQQGYDDAVAAAQRAESRLASLEKDNKRLQAALSTTQGQGERAGFEVERERLRQDLADARAEVDRLRLELRERQAELREAELKAADLAGEKRDLESKLATQMSTRLSISDKYDEKVAELRKLQRELAAKSERLTAVEADLARGTRSASRADSITRDQLQERNDLLSRIDQHVDRIVGDDKSVAKARPHTHFDAFSERITSRLRSLPNLQASVERRVRDLENRLIEQYNALKRQQDSKLRRLDTFDSSVRQAKEVQQQWKNRVHHKQSELEAARSTNHELQEQISSLRSRIPSGEGEPGSAVKVKQSDARASNMERKLSASKEHIGKLEAARESDQAKYNRAEANWIARLKELEQRARAAEEQTKRERQGAKERFGELTEQMTDLQRQVEGAKRRDNRLGDIVAKVRPS